MDGVKKSAIYSDSDVIKAMVEARRIVTQSAEEVFKGDDVTLPIVQTVINEYEYSFLGMLGVA